MEATRAAIQRLGQANDIVGRTGVVLGAVLISLMTVIVVVGVFFRYVLNNSITWVEDVSLIMMVTTAFIVAPYAYRSGANVAIELVIAQLPAVALRVLRIAINVLVLWIIYRHFFESLGLVERGWAIRVNTVPIQWAWPYMIVPVAFVMLVLVGIELILRDLWALAAGSEALDLPHHAPQEPE